MSASWKSTGKTVNWTATAAKTVGDLLVLADTVGVIQDTVTTGQVASVAVVGEHSAVKKASANDGFSLGQHLYAVTTGGVEKLTAVTGVNNEFVGICALAAATGATTGQVILTQGGKA